MSGIVEQERLEKKKLEDELHRKNDIIKTFVNQEFKTAQSTTTGSDVCTTALNSSIYNLWFNNNSDDKEGVEG